MPVIRNAALLGAGRLYPRRLCRRRLRRHPCLRRTPDHGACEGQSRGVPRASHASRASTSPSAWAPASSTAACSVDFVDLLRQRLPAPGHAFVNAGVNGDLAWNALQRLPSVIACDPDAVVVLVGTNDILASLSERVTKTAIKGKQLPTRPTIEWYGENMSRIVFELQSATHARGPVLAPASGREPRVGGRTPRGGVQHRGP